MNKSKCCFTSAGSVALFSVLKHLATADVVAVTVAVDVFDERNYSNFK